MPTVIPIHEMVVEDMDQIPKGANKHPSDTIPWDTRVAKFKEAEAKHKERRAKHEDPDDPWRLPALGWANIFISGLKGDGKTTLASAITKPFYEAGYKVIHNSSLLFGTRIEMMDFYLLGEALPDNCILVVDELHTALSRYSQNRVADRTAISGLAALRKKNVVIITMTSQEAGVSHDWRAEVDFLIYLKKYFPNKSDAFRWKAPPWCYKEMKVIGHHPWRGRMLADQYGIDIFDGDVQCRTKRINPLLMYEGAILQYSFESIDIGAGLNVSAKDVYAMLAAGDGKVVLQDPDDDTVEQVSPQEQAAQQTFTVMKNVLTLYMDGPPNGLPAQTTQRARWDHLWTLYERKHGPGPGAQSAKELKALLQAQTGAPANGLLPSEFIMGLQGWIRTDNPAAAAIFAKFGLQVATTP